MKHLEQLANEIQTAREKYGPFNSTHEVYGVLIEEVAEFFELVRIKNYNPDLFDLKAKDELQESLDNKKSRSVFI